MKKAIAIITITFGLILLFGSDIIYADQVGTNSDSTNISSGNVNTEHGKSGTPINVHIPKKIAKKPKSKPVYAVGKKKLPQTGDSFNHTLTTMGILSLSLTIGLIFKFKSKVWG